AVQEADDEDDDAVEHHEDLDDQHGGAGAQAAAGEADGADGEDGRGEDGDRTADGDEGAVAAVLGLDGGQDEEEGASGEVGDDLEPEDDERGGEAAGPAGGAAGGCAVGSHGRTVGRTGRDPSPAIVRVMRVLVSGGAGYIGSHTVLALVAAGHDVLVVDDFSNSKPSVQGRLEGLAGRPIPFHAFDLTDVDKTERL